MRRGADPVGSPGPPAVAASTDRAGKGVAKVDIGTIQRTIRLFKAALDGVGAKASLLKIEALAIMVHKAMTMQGRSFHTPEHIFNLSDASDPIQALAAAFHDIVYHQVDRGFTPEVTGYIAPYIREEDDAFYLREDVDPEAALFHMTLAVFGYEAGQRLSPLGGQNEFLSALAMNMCLVGIVSVPDLLKATACIEATIPFRGTNADGESPAQVLERRLCAINARYELGMTTDTIYDAVRGAVLFANKDVASFSEEDTGHFLDGTWKLLPETNPSLRLKGVYSVHSYRQALQKMEAFLSTLNPDDIFYMYRGAPPAGEYQRMVALAHRNVNTARQYLGIKLLSAALVEALAEISGGDAPMALFMGDMEGGEDAHRFEDCLPPVSDALVDETSTLFGLLAFGRASASSFDMQNSPLSLFIYRRLGLDGVQYALNFAKAKFAGDLDARGFLGRLPASLVADVADACAVMAITRSDVLRRYADARLGQGQGR